MNAAIIERLAVFTQDGSLSFPQIVGQLLSEGVDDYQVDYRARQFRFYGINGGVVIAPLTFEGLPGVAEVFDAAVLRAAIRDSQQHGQSFREFSRRAMLAGVQSYFACLRGQRVVYLGRLGDQHTEWFPGAGPARDLL